MKRRHSRHERRWSTAAYGERLAAAVNAKTSAELRQLQSDDKTGDKLVEVLESTRENLATRLEQVDWASTGPCGSRKPPRGETGANGPDPGRLEHPALPRCLRHTAVFQSAGPWSSTRTAARGLPRACGSGCMGLLSLRLHPASGANIPGDSGFGSGVDWRFPLPARRALFAAAPSGLSMGGAPSPPNRPAQGCRCDLGRVSGSSSVISVISSPTLA
jgi:hypothetical protein